MSKPELFVERAFLALEMARILFRTTPLPTDTTLTWLDQVDLGIPVMLPESPL